MSTREGGRRRARRGSRPDRSSGQLPEPIGVFRNPLPPVELLGQDDLNRLIDAAFRVLQESGLEFLSARCLDILEKNGCKVDRETGVARMDRATVEHFVGLAPESFAVHGRNPERNTVMGGNYINFNTVGSPPNINDLDDGRRPGTYQALVDLVKLNHALGVCHTMGGSIVEPMDLPVPTRHLDNAYAILKYTDRSAFVRTVSEFRAMDAIEMVAIARDVGLDQLKSECSLLTSFNVNSPRRVDEELLEGLLCFGEYGQAVAVTPFTLAGAMSPVTVAGALVQQTAEALAVIALSQMANPGAPVLFGGFTSNVDMKSGAPAFGTPEYVKAVLIGGQIARYFKLPYRSSNVNASNCVDAQSTYETAMSLWAVIMGHANVVHHGLGWLEGGLSASMEKCVIDAEMIRQWIASLAPMDMSDEALGVEAIAGVEPGGHFFGEQHTLARFETAFYQPMVSDWRNFENWEEAGSKTATERANVVWKQMLEAYEEPPMDEAVDEALKDYMNRRKHELKDVQP
ncbi:trimethylamine methyltransferase family protein [Anderseniella sp. Alg231-50]|uniref:trimethylamine methyltransferase family protein n=1 Tax=Anderseniella sp. Alg231-50 TaxID=1922226 RepID=UPI00307B1DB7